MNKKKKYKMQVKGWIDCRQLVRVNKERRRAEEQEKVEEVGNGILKGMEGQDKDQYERKDRKILSLSWGLGISGYSLGVERRKTLKQAIYFLIL